VINPNETVISQYDNSPILNELINTINADVDPRHNMDLFYAQVWDVESAQAWGLDVWAKIVDTSRWLRKPDYSHVFGFRGSGCAPFNQGTFFNPKFIGAAYELSDPELRKLILVKALANISDCSAPSISTIMRQLFGDQGKCYAQTMGDMHMLYTFEFILTDVARALLTQSKAVIKPAGVRAAVLELDPPTTFGFAGSNLQPFNQGIFAKELSYVS
jgi:Protein of unknown function (DUF2612)